MASPANQQPSVNAEAIPHTRDDGGWSLDVFDLSKSDTIYPPACAFACCELLSPTTDCEREDFRILDPLSIHSNSITHLFPGLILFFS